MNVFLIIGALGLSLLTACYAAVAVRRARASAEVSVAEALQALDDGMHELVRDLAAELERAQAAGHTERLVDALAAAPDPDELIERR